MVPMGTHAQPVGTPPFVAPEVVHGSPLDPRADLYSLGSTLYYALTGRFAYPATDFSQLLERWTVKPPLPSALVPQLPPALDQLVMSLIALEPALRPRSAFEVMERLATLGGIQSSEPLRASEAYLATPALVGREELLGEFREHLQQALQGRGQGLLLSGAAGTGRSRMLDACSIEAKLLGAFVLHADAAAGSSQEFAAARELAERLVEVQPAAALAAARAAGVFDVLFQVLVPDAAEIEPNQPANDVRVRLRSFARPLAERPALQRALIHWYTHVSMHNPVVLAVDDADQLDQSSLALLIALAERASNCALLVLASVERTAEARTVPGLELLRGCSSTLELRALEPAQSELLLSSMFGDVPNVALLSARFYAVTTGNPRQSIELAQYLLDRGSIKFEGSGWSLPEQLTAADLPATAEDAFRARVDALSPLARRLAEAHSLAEHGTFTRDEYRLLESDAEPGTVDDALDELIAHEVLTTDGVSFGLAHRSSANVLASALSAALRRERHRALGAMFQRTDKPTLASARQLLLAGEHERAFAVLMPVLQGPKDRARLMSGCGLGLGEVAETLQLALQHACTIARPAREQHEIRHWLAMLSVVSDEDLFGESAPEWRARLELDSGLQDWRTFVDMGEAGPRLMRALQLAGQRHAAASESTRVYPPDEAIRVLVHYVAISIAIGSRTLDAELVRGLPGLLEPFAPLSPLVHAVWQNAVATVESACDRQSERACARWLEVYQRLENVQGLEAQTVNAIRYAVAFGIGFNEAAIGRDSAALHWAEILDDDPLQRVNAMYLRKIVRLQHGDIEGAERYRKQAELLALQSSSRQMFTNLLTLEINVHASAWDLTGVSQIAARIEPLAERYPGWRTYRHLAEAHYQVLRGDAAAGCAAYERCLELCVPDPNGSPRMYVAWPTAAAAYTDTLIRLDRAAQARDFAARTLEACRERGMISSAHELRRALALALAKLGEYTTAVSQLDLLIDEQLAAGVSGLELGASYEARARVAIWMNDRTSVDRFARLTAQQFRHGRGSSLGARYERLMEEACNSGAIVAAPLSPFETSMFSRSELGSRTALSETIANGMREAQDDAVRAQRALALLCEAHGVSAGLLFLSSSGSLALVATQMAAPPDDVLRRTISDFWSQQSDDFEPDTVFASDDAGQVWTDLRGDGYRAVLLRGATGAGEFTNAGVALLRHDPHATQPMSNALFVVELASYLLRSGDSSAPPE